MPNVAERKKSNEPTTLLQSNGEAMEIKVAIEETTTQPFKLRRNVILVRHGKQNWDKSMLKLPEQDSILTDKGVLQAKTVGEELAKKLKDEQEIYIYTSDLSRAFNTAAAIKKSISRAHLNIYKTEQSVTFEQLDKLEFEIKVIKKGIRERYFGNYSRVASQFVQEDGSIDYSSVPPLGDLPDSETAKDVEKRMLLAIEEITSNSAIPLNATIIIVAHNHSFRNLIRGLCGFMPEIDDIDHCGVLDLRVSPDLNKVLPQNKQPRSCIVNGLKSLEIIKKQREQTQELNPNFLNQYQALTNIKAEVKIQQEQQKQESQGPSLV